MSAPSTQPTARPRPPAKLRRSTNGTSDSNKPSVDTPPPPYQIAPEGILDGIVPLHRRNLSIASVSSNIDASVAVTAQMLGLDLEASATQESNRELDEQYVRQKSREELESLLLKAEAVIRARERELGVAAAVGKQLLDTNLSLRQRHASLVTRTSPFLTAGGAATVLGGQGGDNAPSSPMSPLASPALLHPSTPTFASQRHSRRISTSPAQLAVLSSQNEDLIQALAKLQEETSSANLEGKQKLRKLEKEIAGLRTELEHSHVKNGELEGRIDSVQNDRERQIELKRLEREIRAQELRASTSKQDSAPQTFANFAPTSQSPAKPSFVRAESAQEEEITAKSRPPLIPFPSSESQMTVSSTRSPNPGEPSAELIVLGQLLSKIEELESTNREILQRHRETDSKLRNATSKSDALQKVYEGLEDEVEAYADDEAGTFSADQSPMVDSPMGQSPLLGFRGSFKGRGLGFLYPPPSQRVRSLRERGSPVSSLRGKSSDNSPEQPAHSHNSLSPALFDDLTATPDPDHPDADIDSDHAPLTNEMVGQDESLSLGSRAPKISPLKPKHSKRRLRPKASLDVQMTTAKSTASLSPPVRGLRSSSSHQGLAGKAASSKQVTKPQTLYREFDNDSDNELPVNASREDLASNFEDGVEVDLDEDTIVLNRSSASTVMPLTRAGAMDHEENRAVAAIRRALDPTNAGRPLEAGEHILPVGSLEGSPGESFFLLSHAVEARPNKWIITAPKRRGLIQDSVSRIKHMALPPSMSLGTDTGEDPWEIRYPEESETELDRGRGEGSGDSKAKFDSLSGYASDAATRRTAALSRLHDAAHARSTGSTRRRRVGERYEEDEGDAQYDDHEPNSRGREVVHRRRDGEIEIDGWGKTLLELWIILQAAIILIVFVYSMARRGPRAILDAAEVKRRPH